MVVALYCPAQQQSAAGVGDGRNTAVAAVSKGSRAALKNRANSRIDKGFATLVLTALPPCLYLARITGKFIAANQPRGLTAACPDYYDLAARVRAAAPRQKPARPPSRPRARRRTAGPASP